MDELKVLLDKVNSLEELVKDQQKSLITVQNDYIQLHEMVKKMILSHELDEARRENEMRQLLSRTETNEDFCISLKAELEAAECRLAELKTKTNDRSK